MIKNESKTAIYLFELTFADLVRNKEVELF